MVYGEEIFIIYFIAVKLLKITIMILQLLIMPQVSFSIPLYLIVQCMI